MSRRQMLFHEILQLIGPADGTRWQLQVWDNDIHEFVTLTGTGSGSSYLLAPDSPRPLPAQPLTLRGDPPDFITLAGDLIIVGGYQPPFVQTANGDLIQVRGD